MPSILSTGISLPKFTIKQQEAKALVRHIFPRERGELDRLLPVFDHAKIEERQFIVPKKWFEEGVHAFAERNRIYMDEAKKYSVDAILNCLHNESFLKENIDTTDIDCILFVSSTGIATPTVDAYCVNELPFRDDIVRIPIFGLGCAGGASGLSRANEWLIANPTKTAILVNLEFCSLAFQETDSRKSNLVGTALFGDGVSCTLLAGDKSALKNKAIGDIPYIKAHSSKIKRDTLNVMGWDVQESGFHVIFAKSIPKLVSTFWKEHMEAFMDELQLSIEDIPFITAHPGGAKVLDAIAEVLNCKNEKLSFSYDVLRKHGNMSSPTVIYVLRDVMLTRPKSGETSILTALGPGFSSEILLLEWGAK